MKEKSWFHYALFSVLMMVMSSVNKYLLHLNGVYIPSPKIQYYLNNQIKTSKNKIWRWNIHSHVFFCWDRTLYLTKSKVGPARQRICHNDLEQGFTNLDALPDAQLRNSRTLNAFIKTPYLGRLLFKVWDPS